jgi:hypothetical protein
MEGSVDVSLFAMPPPQVVLVWPIGFLFVLVLAVLFAKATQTRGKRSEHNRRAGLGIMAIICGPVVGASLAWVTDALGGVHPADVGYSYAVFTAIGGIAGTLGAVAFGISGFLTPEIPTEKPPSNCEDSIYEL